MILRWLAILWLAVVVLSGAFLAHRFSSGPVIETDLLALLPKEEVAPDLADIRAAILTNLARRIVVLVGHRDAGQARMAAEHIANRLTASGLMESVAARLDAQAFERLGRTYGQFRGSLLSDGDRELLLADRGAAIADRALAQALMPMSPISAALLQQDPFLLLPNFLLSLPRPNGNFTPSDGMLMARDGDMHYVLVTARIAGSAMDGAVQQRLTDLVAKELAELQSRYPGTQALRAGAALYGYAATRQSTREASLLGAISGIGSILVVLLALRGLWPVGASLLAVGIGSLCGVAACLFVFGHLQMLVVVIGTSLIGSAVDYSVHYSAARLIPDGATPEDRARHLLPGLTLGSATSIAGFLTFLLAPFPALQELAVLSAAGLASSFFTVILWLPYLDRGRRRPANAHFLKLGLWPTRFWHATGYAPLRIGLLGGLFLCGVYGALVLHPDDDIRRMNPHVADLRADESAIRRISGVTPASQFFLVEGRSFESVSAIEERVVQQLRRVTSEGVIGGFVAFAQFIPSDERQADNRELIRTRLEEPHLASLRRKLGLPAPMGGDQGGAVQRSTEPLTLAALEPHLPAAARDLIVRDETNRIMHMIALFGVTDTGALSRLAASIPGVHFVDQAAEISSLLARYRNLAVWLLLLSAVAIFALLSFRYGLRGGLEVIMAPAAAVILAPLLAAALGMPFTFFGAMGMVMVLAMGVDYTVFYREDEAAEPHIALAVLVSAVTTGLSFGALGISQVPGVHMFGLTVFAGIAVAYALTPLALPKARSKLYQRI